MSNFLNRVNTNKSPKKGSSINLSKGQRISLVKKDNTKLTSFCVGANWGAIKKSNFFGMVKTIPVDLDLSAVIIKDKEIKDIVYFGNLTSLGVMHSGDDLVGDTDGDDGLDNEIINVNLNQISNDVNEIFFFLNSFQKQDFADIPFASIRLYEGTPTRVNKIFALYNIANDRECRGYISMILGKLYKKNNNWSFAAIGDPIRATDINSTINTILNEYIGR